MGLITPTLPTIGQLNATEDVDVRNALQALVTLVNGGLDSANITDGSLTEADLTAALLEKLGLTGGGSTRRGKIIIPTEEVRANAAFGKLPTPDEVVGIVLPTDGFIVVGYQAEWKSSIASAGSAAIFLGANQIKTAQEATAAPLVQAATSNSSPNVYRPLGTFFGGLKAFDGATPYAGDVATGQVLAPGTSSGGPCFIFAAAGTYTVSVQFLAGAGTVTAKNRKLWVWTIGF